MPKPLMEQWKKKKNQPSVILIVETQLFSITPEKYFLLSCIRNTRFGATFTACLFYRASCRVCVHSQNPAKSFIW